MDDRHIVIVHYNDDWVGLYVDGQLELQGHSLPVRDVIAVLTGKAPKSYEIYEDVNRGYLPDDLGALSRFLD